MTRWLLRVVGLVVLATGLTGCATSALRQAESAEDAHDYDLAVARYTRIVREQPENRNAQLGLERARLRASATHLTQGRRLYSLGRYEDAIVELQLATELNPTSAESERELRGARNNSHRTR